MRVSVYSREAIEHIIAEGSFPDNTAVISFCYSVRLSVRLMYQIIFNHNVSDSIFAWNMNICQTLLFSEFYSNSTNYRKYPQ